MTKVELTLIPDPEIYIFCGKVTRGKVFCISKSYGKASNTYLKSSDPKQKSKHVIHLDGNNLYGHAISKSLPTNGFKWIHSKEFNLNEYTSNSSR